MTQAERDTAQQFWEDHYRTHDQVWSGRANAILVEVVEKLAPGRALDLGCGEGADAIWLASRGWEVTAVDVSETALRRAYANSIAAGVDPRIQFEHHDLARSLPDGVFDLVSAQYLHSPVALPRARVLRAAAERVAPAGLLLVVDHASVSPWSWNKQQTRFPSPEETLAELKLAAEQWRVERLDARKRQAIGPDRQVAVVTDNVIVLRRQAG